MRLNKSLRVRYQLLQAAKNKKLLLHYVVEGFVFVLFDVPVEFVCFSQLFIDPFELFAKSLAFLLVSLEFRLQLFGLSGH